MNALAADTGGFLVENANDLRAGLRRILKDTETYYVLAYEPTNTKRDGGFRRIEVRLPNRRDLRVRTRSGYFAPDERRAAATSATMQDQARRAEQRRAEMRTALGSLAPLTAIPVRLSADFVSLDGGARSGRGQRAAWTWRRCRSSAASDRRQATVETVAVVYDEDGSRSPRRWRPSGRRWTSPTRTTSSSGAAAFRTGARSRSSPADTRCASRRARTPRGCWGARGGGSRSPTSPRAASPSAASSC